MTKQAVLSYIKNFDLCTLATATRQGKPQVAVMAFSITSDWKIYICTEPNTRKYANLLTNKKVSLVIGGYKNDPTVQLDGLAKRLTGDAARKALDYTVAHHPDWQDYYSSDTSRWFAITIKWIRYSDYSQNPPEVQEYTFKP